MFVLPFCNSGVTCFLFMTISKMFGFVASSAEELFKFCPGTYRCVCAVQVKGDAPAGLVLHDLPSLGPFVPVGVACVGAVFVLRY
jgi:hypothetical protein